MLHIHIILLLVFFAKIWNLWASPVPEGLACNFGNGAGQGICKTKSRCTFPAEQARNSSAIRNLRSQCGFAGRSRLFCCLATTTQAEKACNRYKEYARQNFHRLISGGKVAKKGDYRHMAALWYNITDEKSSPWQCGGTIIHHRFILTAAHCLTGLKPYKVRVGDIDLQSDEDDKLVAEYLVEEVKIHPRYNAAYSRYNDIGIVKTKTTIAYNKFVFPACLETSPHDQYDYTITGWGSTAKNNLQRIYEYQPLRVAQVQHMDSNDCSDAFSETIGWRALYPKGIIKSLVCVEADDTNEGHPDTCQGDSGGPLQYPVGISYDIYTIAGVTSFGVTCGGKKPGIYTRVREFVPWIETFVVWQ